LTAPEERQRIDRWLWHARLVRTRAAAAALAQSGHVRVNGQRIAASSRPVRVGDVLTVALDRAVRVLRVTAFAERRAGTAAAQALYEDLSPAPQEPVGPSREHDSGRPTRRERRALLAWKRNAST
jgi:ribosome-associated heat shock protein Hsp15